MEILKIILSFVIIIGAVYMLVRKFETRAILFIAGLLMFLLSGDILGAF